MKKTIINYAQEGRIVLSCSEILKDEYKKAREELIDLGFKVDRIASDSFWAVRKRNMSLVTLASLRELGYSF